MIRSLVVLALVSGCSVALQAKPQKTAAKCSTTNAYWIADLVGVAAGLAAVAVAEVTSNESDAPNAIAGVGLVGGVVFAASASNGYKWARECRSNNETAPIALR
jgi:hypothetical protein